MADQSILQAAAPSAARGPSTALAAGVFAADATLPDDVRPVASHPGVHGALTSARRVLLTGATGFLGRWIARTLLVESDASLLCLVRGRPDEIDGRLHAALETTGLDPVVVGRRVTAVNGDLARDRLGLTATGFDALAGGVDAICHAGATVNWIQPYHALRAANVGGTLELLRLAASRSTPLHFVSSLSVCYSTSAPPAVDGRYDAMGDIGGLHLGYAQTKAVAEALVREAGRRGLPIAIYRPSLIAGHSDCPPSRDALRRTNAYNRDDILTRVISGCVRMGIAPDLEWSLDCLPVDVAAQHIAGTPPRPDAVHLAHRRPRDWRECVLWLRLYGYDVRLVPYREWLARLDRETRDAGDRAHPLRPLRPFFLRRVPSDRGQTLPELLTGSDRDFGVTEAIGPPLDAALLQRYCDAFVACGDLPPGRARSVSGGGGSLDAAFFSRVMGRAVTAVEPLGRLSEHGIISELTTWQSGCATGLFQFRLRDGADLRDVVVKIKPRDRDVLAVGAALSHLCDTPAGIEYDRWSERLGIVNAGARELAIYRQQDPRFLDHAPALLGGIEDRDSGITTLVLESLSGSILRDSADRPHLWRPVHVDCAIRGLARLHAIWFGRTSELLRLPWIGHAATTSSVAAMSDFWRAIAAHARPAFVGWTDGHLAGIHDRLIDRIRDWRRALDEGPRTLVHNDFNPRNVCLRPGPGGPRLTAYDWELATIGAPQRDLAEFLCFVLPERPARHEVEAWIDRHRILLEDETGAAIDRRAWRDGFRAGLYELLLDRLPMYCLIDRVRRQSFLPRVVRTWRALYEQFPLE